jgi:hypothetical protein
MLTSSVATDAVKNWSMSLGLRVFLVHQAISHLLIYVQRYRFTDHQLAFASINVFL